MRTLARIAWLGLWLPLAAQAHEPRPEVPAAGVSVPDGAPGHRAAPLVSIPLAIASEPWAEACCSCTEAEVARDRDRPGRHWHVGPCCARPLPQPSATTP
jgi:hypothetical protein